MRRARQITALLANLLLAQLLWVGSGFACMMPDMGRPAGAMAGMDMPGSEMAGMEMAGMEMAGMEMAGMGMPGADGGPSEAPVHDHAPCQLPWAVGGCSQAAACVPIALASASQALQSPGGKLISLPPTVVPIPTSVTRAPELPPPKA